MRPNVVLLVIDALRADAIEPFGAPPGSSPEIAKLARGGVTAPEVRSTASWTLPSHTAMFTGQLARGLGLGQAPDRSPQSAAPTVRAQQDRLLAEVLRTSGYATWGVTGNVWAGAASGFDTGFEQFDELRTSRHGELGGRFRHRLKWNLEAVRAAKDDGAQQAQEAISERLRSRDGRPFFLFVNLVEVHSPYLPPRPHSGGSALMRLRAAQEANRYLTFTEILRTCVGAQSVPAAALERMRTLYAASVRCADDWVGRLLAALAAHDELERTLVVLCSDHGENLGEGGLITHGLSLDERLLRVPLVAAGPGAETFRDMRSLAEIPPRVATAVGLDDHPWSDGLVEGLPVAQWDPYRLSDEELSDLARNLDLDEGHLERLRVPLTCAVDGTFKLVRRGTDELLFDLSADPLEAEPITDPSEMAARAGDTVQRLRSAVTSPVAQATRDAVTAPAQQPSSAEDAAEIERKMRLLGYL